MFAFEILQRYTRGELWPPRKSNCVTPDDVPSSQVPLYESITHAPFFSFGRVFVAITHVVTSKTIKINKIEKRRRKNREKEKKIVREKEKENKRDTRETIGGGGGDKARRRAKDHTIPYQYATGFIYHTIQYHPASVNI